MSEHLTGRFGFIVGAELDKQEIAHERAANAITDKVWALARDGRDFLIRTRRSRMDSELVGEMFTNDVLRYKVIIWIALEDYEKAEIGEHTFLPDDFSYHPPLEWFSRPDSYTNDEGQEVPMRVNIVKVGDLWFEEDFIIEFNRQTYRRIESPDISILTAKTSVG